MRWMMLLTASCLLVACASQPKTASKPAPESTTITSAPAMGNNSGIVTEEEFAKEAKNYKLVEKDGRQLYCRQEATLGSRLPQTVCLTHTQLTESIRRTREVKDSLRQRGGGECGIAGAGCGT